ncbi:MAG: site-specific DNA-methyltransferase, partial [Treponema sp.]|nr:site-specific DNA-methyltransferase [Treponema sp.]
MTHLSENPSALKVRIINDDIENIIAGTPNAELVILPFYENLESVPAKLYDTLNNFMLNGDENSTFILFTSPVFAVDYCSKLPTDIYYKLWIAVQTEFKNNNSNGLKENHSALLVFTKYNGSLRHTKTRMAYTYCPACSKTTKDYGGKKHLYHEFGTLLSDVWRNVSFKEGEYPEQIIDILKDLFGLKEYEYLNVYDKREMYKSMSKPHIYKSFSRITNIPDNNEILYNGDCIKYLKSIPDNSIDFCFADPPYNLMKKYNNFDDGIDIKEYFKWCDSWLYELGRIVKPNCTVAILNIPQWCIRHFKYLSTVLDYYDWIVWEGLSLPVRMIMPAHYSIICFSKGKPRDISLLSRDTSLEEKYIKSFSNDYCMRPNCINERKRRGINDSEYITNLWWNIHRLKHNANRVDHPCQLPPLFMLRLISLFTRENEIVLDPFNGVGTTTLSAKMLNRKYIGIELSEYYHNIA